MIVDAGTLAVALAAFSAGLILGLALNRILEIIGDLEEARRAHHRTHHDIRR